VITAEKAPGKTDITLSVRNVSKTFYGITVLSDFSLDIHRGEIVALIGQNGSGKSTFIKILSGFHSPEPGASFSMGERDISGVVGQTAEHTGMAFIHQDLPLIASMTILENLRIARFTTGFAGRILWHREEAEVARILATVGLFVSPRLRVDQLSVTEQALVAIARGLSEVQSEDPLSPRLLVLDEPTAYLPLDGVKRLFGVIHELAGQGISILFVSHRLDEVLDYCTRAVVLRGGELVADLPTMGLTERDLVESMLGSPPGEIYPDRDIDVGERVLKVTGLSGSNLFDADFVGHRGEIIGFVGLPGEGYDQIPYLLAGAQPCTGGTAVIEEATIDLRKLNPGKAIQHGIVLLPADRKGASGATQLAVGDNLTLPTLSRYTRLRSVLRHRRERQVIQTELERFAVTPANGAAPLATLSGGNQQKVLIAKWAMADHKVFLLHEPTQGVDVGAKRQVFAHLNNLARQGALLVISSVEYDDLVNICHRVHVVRQGRIARTFSGDQLNAHDLAAAVHQR
jgi:ribose transport system ATP-binding protein